MIHYHVPCRWQQWDDIYTTVCHADGSDGIMIHYHVFGLWWGCFWPCGLVQFAPELFERNAMSGLHTPTCLPSGVISESCQYFVLSVNPGMEKSLQTIPSEERDKVAVLA